MTCPTQPSMFKEIPKTVRLHLSNPSPTHYKLLQTCNKWLEIVMSNMHVRDRHYLRIISTAIWTFSDKKQLHIRMDKFLHNSIIIWILSIRQKGNLLCTYLFSKQTHNQDNKPLLKKNNLQAAAC